MTLPRTAPTQELSATRDVARAAERLATKKIWLPKFLYDSLPWFYLAAGLTALFATIYISDWFWILPHYLLFSMACLHLSFTVYRKRRKSRMASTDVARN